VAIASNPFIPQANNQQHAAPAAAPNNARVNGAEGTNAVNGAALKNESISPSEEEVDAARGREIAAKAVTGILVLLLKWLKLSRK
jgi:hypothetical protein